MCVCACAYGYTVTEHTASLWSSNINTASSASITGLNHFPPQNRGERDAGGGTDGDGGEEGEEQKYLNVKEKVL